MATIVMSLRVHTVTGRRADEPSAKPRQKPNILASQRPSFSIDGLIHQLQAEVTLG